VRFSAAVVLADPTVDRLGLRNMNVAAVIKNPWLRILISKEVLGWIPWQSWAADST